MKAIFKIGNDKNKKHQYITGRIIKEYENFYLVETQNGYKECVNKSCLICGDAERVV
jgi:hypothetical protein